MYTFRKDPRGIIVISESGCEIPWGSKGSIPDEGFRLMSLNVGLHKDFEEWSVMTNAERVAMKEEFFNNEKTIKTMPKAMSNFVLGELNFISTFSASTPFSMGIKKEEETMNTRFEDTQEGKAQAHVLRRADIAFREKEDELHKHYGLRDDDAPHSWNELIKRIKDGKFKISEEHAKLSNYDPMCYVSWRDPKIEEDHEGFDKSMEKLRKLLAETKDVIIVKSAADGLEMVEKIQNFKH